MTKPKASRRRRDPEAYILEVLERGRWVERSRWGWPAPLIDAAQALSRAGQPARVMHGRVEVGAAPGPVF